VIDRFGHVVCPRCGHIITPNRERDPYGLDTDVERKIWELIRKRVPDLLREICEIRSHRWHDSLSRKTRQYCGLCLTERVKPGKFERFGYLKE